MGFFKILLIIGVFLGGALGLVNSFKSTKKGKSEGKYLCVPCGYIYDPLIGDVDSGIAPGTRFEDIPDTWRCPVCGVTKADFIPLGKEEKRSPIIAKIVKHVFINAVQDVLLLKIEVSEKLHVSPGQYFSFMYSDSQGDFRRSYSVVKVKGNVYTFLIRIEKEARGGSILKSKKVGDTINIYGVFGNFQLQATENKKVFIGTGTGLAPLYHMILGSKRKDNILIFGSKNMDDIFYLEELSHENVKNVLVYLSREENIPENFGKIIFKKGRVDLDSFFKDYPEHAEKNTEFYLCGNPKLVESIQEKLKDLSYENIFTEKF